MRSQFWRRIEHQSMSLAMLGIAIASSLAAGALFFLTRTGDPTDARRQFESALKSHVLNNSAASFNENVLRNLRIDTSLLIAETFLPRALDTEALSWLKAEAACQPGRLPNSADFAKWKKWIGAKCAGDQSFPRTVLETPPFVHPLGGSWARYILKSQRDSWARDESWRSHLNRYLHILELEQELELGSEILPAVVPTKILPGEWKQIYEMDSWTLTNDHLWIGSSGAWRILNRKTFESWVKHEGWQVSASNTCNNPTNGLCFVEVPRQLQKPENWIVSLLLIAVLFFIFSFIGLYLQKRAHEQRLEEDRQMVMQTLAHELRHPATSLQLSLEVMRDQFDSLPAESQMEFLRMLDQVQRLRRVLEASRQYLNSDRVESGFRFDKKRIDNLNEFIETTLAPYAGKISIQTSEGLATFHVDRYWFGLCLTNLVKNALIHGRQPIEVNVLRTPHGAMIEVCDAGDRPTLSFEEMITPLAKGATSPGMGLGLSLVHRLMGLMGGRLEYVEQPKAFRLLLEEKAQ